MADPSLCLRDEFTVMGLQTRLPDPAAADYGALWGAYHERFAELQPLALDDCCYGVYFGTDTTDVDFMAASTVAPDAAVLTGMVQRVVPCAEFAVFTCAMSEIGTTWHTAYGEWMPGSGFEPDPGVPAFEAFGPGVHEGTQPVEVWVPVRKTP